MSAFLPNKSNNNNNSNNANTGLKFDTSNQQNINNKNLVQNNNNNNPSTVTTTATTTTETATTVIIKDSENKQDLNNNNNSNTKTENEANEQNNSLPLQYAWTLWHSAPSTTGRWNENYKEIAQFSSVEEFWRLFNNISPPSLLAPGSAYHLFKGKVKPEWEDRFNANGGSWTYRFGGSFTKGNRHHNAKVDAEKSANYAWYHTVLNMIGNNFNHYEDICGLVINLKSNGRGKIELWIKDAKTMKKVIEIGQQFKNFSGAARKKGAGVMIDFQSFADQLNKTGRRDKIQI